MIFLKIPECLRLKEIDVSDINYKTTTGGIIYIFAIGYNATLRTIANSKYSVTEKVSVIVTTYKMLWRLLIGARI